MRITKTKLGTLTMIVALSPLGVLWFGRQVGASKIRYSVVIPADIPAEILLHPKQGVPFPRNGPELYASSHQRGWNECLEDFRAGKLTAESGPIAKQQFADQARAEADGYRDCRTELSRLIEIHGTLPVRVANR
jgi:hypothetical protein